MPEVIEEKPIEDTVEKAQEEEKTLPSLEVAEAKIAQALKKYNVSVSKTQLQEQEVVRL